MTRLRVQFSLRLLLLAILVVSIYLAWFVVERRIAERRQQAYEMIEAAAPYTSGRSVARWPWYSRGLHSLLGDAQPQELVFLVFSNFAEVDDSTLEAIAQFPELTQLWLNGEIAITDAGLRHLKGLGQLETLNLGDATLSRDAIDDVCDALPSCRVIWNEVIVQDVPR